MGQHYPNVEPVKGTKGKVKDLRKILSGRTWKDFCAFIIYMFHILFNVKP